MNRAQVEARLVELGHSEHAAMAIADEAWDWGHWCGPRAHGSSHAVWVDQAGAYSLAVVD